jgi:hypothetical protein
MYKEHKDYYAVLRLDPSADATAVQEAYWRLVHTVRSMASTDPSAWRRLEEVNEAYSILATPVLRDEYDRSLIDAPAEEEAAQVPGCSKQILALPLWRSALAAGGLYAVAIWLGIAGGSAALALSLLTGGLTLALVPRLCRSLFIGTSAWYPAHATLGLARLACPRVRFPRISRLTSELLGNSHVTARLGRSTGRSEPAVDPEELRASTVDAVARWRQGADAAPPFLPPKPSPEERAPEDAADDPPS